MTNTHIFKKGHTAGEMIINDLNDISNLTLLLSTLNHYLKNISREIIKLYLVAPSGDNFHENVF